jgi:hypothetical protein
VTFDDQLRRTLDTLTDRIRDEVSRQLEAVLPELATAAEREREAAASRAASEARESAERTASDRLAAAVSAADERARGLEARGREAAERAREAEERVREAETRAREAEERARADGREEGHAGGFQAGRKAARNELQAKEMAAGRRLAEGIRAMDDARSLSEVLGILLEFVGSEARRAGVLVVRDLKLQGWRFVGFDPDFEAPQRVELALTDAGIISEAVGTSSATWGDSERQAAPQFAAPLRESDMLALPIALGGQVVALIYADKDRDEGRAGSGNPWPAALEVMARHAARCLEAMTAVRTAQLLTR